MSFEEVVDYKNLLNGGLDACNGGRWKPSVQSFELTLLRHTSVNKKQLKERKYKPYKTNDFMLRERGKWRIIKAHKIKDRQVYKSFCKYELKPCTKNLIVNNNAASQVGKGTLYSIQTFKKGLVKATRKWKNDFYVVTFDFHDYFGSILHNKITEVIHLSDKESNKLLQQYVDIFPGNCGIGIGGEPSQDISIVFPSKIDKMLCCDKTVLDSGRYMDDGYAICHAKEEAIRVLENIRKVAEELGLILNEKRTKICWMKKDSIIWLKKRTFITNSGRIVMRLTRENVNEELRRIKYQKEKIDNGEMNRSIADASIECWCSYAFGYNSRRMMKRVIEAYMQTFDVPWSIAKVLMKKHHNGWLKSINNYLSERRIENEKSSACKQ